MYDKFKFLKNMSPYAAVNFIRKGIGYEAYLQEKAKETGASLKKWMEELDSLQESARNFETLKEWLTHIENYDESPDCRR